MNDPARTGDGDGDALRQIYQSTRGYCDGCRRKLAFRGFARTDVRGAWDLDARALRPRCRACLQGHVLRASRAPRPALVTAAATRPARRGWAPPLVGGLLGALVLGGPWGALVGGLVGAGVDGDEG